MKKIKYLILFVMLLFTLDVYALNRGDANLKNRHECDRFDVMFQFLLMVYHRR